MRIATSRTTCHGSSVGTAAATKVPAVALLFPAAGSVVALDSVAVFEIV